MERKHGRNLLSGFTGLTKGKEYMISVKRVHNSSTQLVNRPNLPSQNGPCLILLRPLTRSATTGIQYEMYNNTIHAVTMLSSRKLGLAILPFFGIRKLRWRSKLTC